MKVANALGASVYPTFVLLDKYARIRYRGKMPSQSNLADWTGKLWLRLESMGASAPLFGVAQMDIPTLFNGTCLASLAGKPAVISSLKGPRGTLLLFVDTKCMFSAATITEHPDGRGPKGDISPGRAFRPCLSTSPTARPT